MNTNEHEPPINNDLEKEYATYIGHMHVMIYAAENKDQLQKIETKLKEIMDYYENRKRGPIALKGDGKLLDHNELEAGTKVTEEQREIIQNNYDAARKDIKRYMRPPIESQDVLLKKIAEQGHVWTKDDIEKIEDINHIISVAVRSEEAIENPAYFVIDHKTTKNSINSPNRGKPDENTINYINEQMPKIGKKLNNNTYNYKTSALMLKSSDELYKLAKIGYSCAIDIRVKIYGYSSDNKEKQNEKNAVRFVDKNLQEKNIDINSSNKPISGDTQFADIPGHRDNTRDDYHKIRKLYTTSGGYRTYWAGESTARQKAIQNIHGRRMFPNWAIEKLKKTRGGVFSYLAGEDANRVDAINYVTNYVKNNSLNEDQINQLVEQK